MPNRIRSKPKQFVADETAKADGFDLEHTQNVAVNSSAFIRSFRLKREDHMLPEFSYSQAHMRTLGVQPINREMPIPVTIRLPIHSSLAGMEDSAYAAIDRKKRDEEQAPFELEKAQKWRRQWQRVSAGKELVFKLLPPSEAHANGTRYTVPQYIPKISKDAFQGLKLPQEVKRYASFISLEGEGHKLPTQTVINVGDNRDENGLLLSEFEDYNFVPKARRYVISRDEPIWPDNREKLVAIYDDGTEALANFLSERQKVELMS